MEQDIENLLKKIKADSNIVNYDKLKVKQSIVLRILNSLGWDIFSPDEVLHQNFDNNEGADIILKINKRCAVFLLVRNSEEDFQKTTKDILFNSDVREGFLIVTDGKIWTFFLLSMGKKITTQKFCSIDIFHFRENLSAELFQQFLLKENILNGSVKIKAEEKLETQINEFHSDTIISKAWDSLISKPNSLLVALILEKAEEFGGCKIDCHSVEDFLRLNKKQLLIGEYPEMSIQISTSTYHNQKGLRIKKTSSRESGHIAIKIDERIFEAEGIPTLFLNILKFVVDSGRIEKLSFPWGLGAKRYFVFKGDNPKHSHGRIFFTPITYKDYHLEAHVNRRQGIKNLVKFLEALGYSVKVVDL